MPTDVTIEEQIACVQREIKLREYTYRKQVAHTPSVRPTLVKEYRAMCAVLATLQEVKNVNDSSNKLMEMKDESVPGNVL